MEWSAEAGSEEGSPPSIADGVERSLDPRAVLHARIVGWIVTASIGSGMLMGAIVAAIAIDGPAIVRLLPLLGWGIAVCLLSWATHAWPAIDHRHTRYRVDEQGIEIRTGVVWRSVVNVPRARVQHIDVSQGPLERQHSLATLHLYTAGTDHAEVGLHGLERDVALAIRDHLLAGRKDDVV